MVDMNRLNRLLNTTLAGEIARKLDKKDGSPDQRISGKNWNIFVGQIGAGKTIDENGSISVFDAMNSITTYVVRKAGGGGEKADNLAKEWLNNFLGDVTLDENTAATQTPENVEQTPETENVEQTQTPEHAEGAENVQEDEGAGNPEQAQDVATEEERQAKIDAEYASVRVKVPVKKPGKSILAIGKAQNEGKAISKEFENNTVTAETFAKINKDNVAYVLNKNLAKISEMLVRCGKYDKILNLLKQKANSLKLNVEKADSPRDTLRKYSKAIIQAENKFVTTEREKRAYHNNNRTKIQKEFDDANRFLAEAANTDKSQIRFKGEKKPNGVQFANIGSKWIGVTYGNDGKIIYISISTKNVTEKDKGNNVDAAEVSYSKDSAECNFDKPEGEQQWAHDTYIKSGYDFEKIKELAERIFS